MIRKVIVNKTARIPITGQRKSGLNSDGVPKVPTARAVRNPFQRKPFGT